MRIRNNKVNVFLSDDEKFILKRASSKLNLSQSEYIRNLSVGYEIKIPEVKEEPKSEPAPTGKPIVLGLNDKIAFEKNLFAGNGDDLQRVLSQLNTFTNWDEAKSFVLDFVKPDYNNWENKEEFEVRFLEIVENKFQ